MSASIYEKPFALTVSGNEITDALRALGVQGDGRINDSSYGIWEGTTNLLLRGGFESGITGWAGVSGTLTSSSEWAKFGTKSGKLVATAPVQYLLGAAALSGATAGRRFTLSAHAKKPLVPYYTRVLNDDFERADTAPGTIGTAPTGQVWGLTGTGYLTAKILSGRYVCPNDNVYAYLDLGVAPARLRAKVSWAAGTANTSEAVLVSSPFATLLETMIHCQFFYDSFNLQVRVASGAFVSIGGGAYASPCVRDGTVYNIGWSVSGNTITVELPDGNTQAVTDSRISTCNGRWLTYQIANAASGSQVRYESLTADSVGTRRVRAQINETGGATGTELLCYTDAVVGGDGTVRVAATGAVVRNDRTGLDLFLYDLDSLDVGEVVYFDGIQLEERSVATPYVHTDGATASRSGARVQIPVNDLDETQGYAAFYVRPGWAAADDPHATFGNPILFQWADDTNNRIGITYDVTVDKWRARRLLAGAGATADSPVQTFPAGFMQLVVMEWTATTLALNVNGGAFASVANSSIPVLAATLADIGTGGTIFTTNQFEGDVLWASWGSRVPTQADTLVLYQMLVGGNDPRLLNLNGWWQ